MVSSKVTITTPPKTPPSDVAQASAPEDGGVPKEWREGRAAKAEEWFQVQKEELHRRYWSQRNAAANAAARPSAEPADTVTVSPEVQAMISEQQAFSLSVQQQLGAMRQLRLTANLEYQALRLPHFTPPRPLALLAAPHGGSTFRERLFNRALATTLMAAVELAPPPAAAAAAAGGGAGSAVRDAGGLLLGGGVEAVWCEMGQSRIGLQDPPLARAEALERCRVAVVVLSPALAASPTWPLERRILTARLAAPPGAWPGPDLAGVIVVRLHIPPPPSAAAAAAAAVAGQGRKATAAAVAAAAAAAAASDPHPAPPPLELPPPVPGYPVQSYSVKVVDVTLSVPAEPGLEGAAAGTAMAQAVRAAVAEVLSAVSSLGALPAAGLRLLPHDPPPVYLAPSHVAADLPQRMAAAAAAAAAAAGAASASAAEAASLAASLRSTLSAFGGGGTGTGGATSGTGAASVSLATQLLVCPAVAALAPGAAACAAHLLPAAHCQRAVEDWTQHDVQAWLSRLGSSVSRWSAGLAALAVDGPLVAVADGDDLAHCCGVAAEGARGAMMGALASALRRPAAVPPSRLLRPGPDCPSAPLPPEAAVLPPLQRAAVMADIAAYYDEDHSGDLSAAELGRLLSGCGLVLGEERVLDVLHEYDVDCDGALCWAEAEAVLGDVWRLVMAQQDLAAWTPAEAGRELEDAADLEWPLETPRATPDAERVAAGAAARMRGGSGTGGGGGGGGSETASSINIVGSGRGGASSRLPSAAAPSAALPSAAAASAAAASQMLPPGSALSGRGGGSGGGSGGGVTPGTDGGLAAAAVEGEDETGARVRLLDKTTAAAAAASLPPTTAATAGSPFRGDQGSDGGGGSGGGADSASDVGSLLSYAWGLPPRLALGGGGRGRGPGGDGGSVTSATAPWAGAITPRVPRLGGGHVVCAEELRGRDVDVAVLLRRGRGEAEMRDTLASLLGGLDLRRDGRVEVNMLRASLASGGPPAQLTPLHTQLLADLAEETAHSRTTLLPAGPTRRQPQQQQPSTATSAGPLVDASLAVAGLEVEVAVQPYIEAGVRAVCGAQAGLLGAVYGERGTSAMLRQLYRQGAGPDDPLELLTLGPRVHERAAEEALEALMGVRGLQPTSLLRSALLPHHQLQQPEALPGAAEEAGDGSGAASGSSSARPRPHSARDAPPVTPLSLLSARRFPQSWASATAHVLHVFQELAGRGF